MRVVDTVLVPLVLVLMITCGAVFGIALYVAVNPETCTVPIETETGEEYITFTIDLSDVVECNVSRIQLGEIDRE